MGTVSTSAIPPSTFTGTSSYATSLQQVITNDMNIAEMPLQQMQGQLQTFQSQSSALSGLDSDFTSLQTALQGVDTALGSGSFTASSSDETEVSASAASGALPATYTIAVSNLGSYSSSVSDSSLPTVSDPTTTSISSSTNYTLTVGGTQYNVQPSSDGLTALAEAVNDSGAPVQASLVNQGSSSSPNYSLVVTADSLGPVSIQLNDGSKDLLDTLNTGGAATYTVNGVGTGIQTDSRTVTLEPGVTINLLAQTPADQPVTVTVSRDLTSVANALSSFTTAYNTVVSDLNAQVGQNAGPLSGESIIGTLRDTLSQISLYATGSGNVSSLAALGVNLDSTGNLSFDSSTFTADSVDSVSDFLGSVSGGGFLQAANNALNSALDPTSGSLTDEISATSSEITQQNTNITAEDQKLTNLQSTLDQQMSSADAMIASLESQKSYFTSLFASMVDPNSTSNDPSGS
jgi:flagellar hook-associated protein 2